MAKTFDPELERKDPNSFIEAEDDEEDDISAVSENELRDQVPHMPTLNEQAVGDLL